MSSIYKFSEICNRWQGYTWHTCTWHVTDVRNNLLTLPLATTTILFFLYFGSYAAINLSNYRNVAWLWKTYRKLSVSAISGVWQFWSARSPDLNPCDFSTWGHVKTLVHKTPLQYLGNHLNVGKITERR